MQDHIRQSKASARVFNTGVRVLNVLSGAALIVLGALIGVALIGMVCQIGQALILAPQ